LSVIVDKYYTLDEACEYLGVSRATMNRIIRNEDIAYSKIGQGRGTYRFTQKDIEEYVEHKKVKAKRG